jgi:hypothetical protein
MFFMFNHPLIPLRLGLSWLLSEENEGADEDEVDEVVGALDQGRRGLMEKGGAGWGDLKPPVLPGEARSMLQKGKHTPKKEKRN